MNDNQKAALFLKFLAFFFGLIFIAVGLSYIQSANLSSLGEGLAQLTAGVISTGTGITLTLVALGQTSIIGKVLNFILKAAPFSS